MTTMLRPELAPPAVRKQLQRKPYRRLILVGRQLWRLEIGSDGILFRENKKQRDLIALPWSEILKLAEHRAGDLLHQEQLRQAALRRMQRGSRIRR